MPTPSVAPSASVIASAGIASAGHAFTSPGRATTDGGDELSEGDAGGKALLTKEAKEAGREAAGPKATDRESLEAYWTPERMRSAKPAAADPAYQQAVERFEEEQKQLIESGKPDENQAKQEGRESSTDEP